MERCAETDGDMEMNITEKHDILLVKVLHQLADVQHHVLLGQNNRKVQGAKLTHLRQSAEIEHRASHNALRHESPDHRVITQHVSLLPRSLVVPPL